MDKGTMTNFQKRFLAILTAITCVVCVNVYPAQPALIFAMGVIFGLMMVLLQYWRIK